MADHKEYLDEQYKLAALDYRTAHTDEEQWNARKRMAQTERTASELYDFFPSSCYRASGYFPDVFSFLQQ